MNANEAFSIWLKKTCFQEPTQEAYDLARMAWEAAARQGQEKTWPAGLVELKSNHLDCCERKDCAGYRPAPVCQKIHLQGCFQNIKVKP